MTPMKGIKLENQNQNRKSVDFSTNTMDVDNKAMSNPPSNSHILEKEKPKTEVK